MRREGESNKEWERRDQEEWMDQLKAWERQSLIDAAAHPDLYSAWIIRREMVNEGFDDFNSNKKNVRIGDGMSEDALSLVRRRRAFHWARIYDMFETKGQEFHLDNSFMDLDGRIHVIRDMIKGDNSEMEIFHYFKEYVDDMAYYPDSKPQKRARSESIPRAGPSRVSPRSNSPELSPPGRASSLIPLDGITIDSSDEEEQSISPPASPPVEKMSEKKAGKQREIDPPPLAQDILNRKKPKLSLSSSRENASKPGSSSVSSSSTSSTSTASIGPSSNSPRPTVKKHPRPPRKGPPPTTTARERTLPSMGPEYFKVEDQPEVKPKEPKGVPKPRRHELPVADIFEFELLDHQNELLNLLLLGQISDDNKRYSFENFKITGRIGDVNGESIKLGPDDFVDLELRLHVSFDEEERRIFYLHTIGRTFQIASYTKRYSIFCLHSIHNDDVSAYTTELQFLPPQLFRSLPRDMHRLFRTDPNFDLKALLVDMDEEAEFVNAQLKIEPFEMTSEPSGLPKMKKHWKEDGKRIQVYKKAIVKRDGKTMQLEAGDCVSILSSEEDPKRPVWFGRIVYFFRSQDNAPLEAHISYFVSPTGTFLKEAAEGRRFLFLANFCDDCLVSVIQRKVEISYFSPESNVPPPGFYYAFALEEGTRNIVDAGPFENSTDFSICSEYEIYNCRCCESREKKDLADRFRLFNGSNSIHHKNRVYHVNDTIAFLRPPGLRSSGVLRLGRICSITPGTISSVKVALLLRSDDIFDNKFKDPRRLILTDIEESIAVERIAQKITVDHAQVFATGFDLSSNGHDPNSIWPSNLHKKKEKLSKDYSWFWTNQFLTNVDIFHLHVRKANHKDQSKKFPLSRDEIKGSTRIISREEVVQCKICRKAGEKRIEEDEKIAYLPSKEKELNSFEPYSGGSLLGLGIHQGCESVTTKFACDFASHQVETTKLNNDITTHVHLATTSEINEAVYLKEGTREHIPLPNPDSIQFISAGPPCQGFSRANLYRYPENPKCLEPIHLFSSISLLRPWFSVMENVRDIASFELPTKNDTALINVLAMMAIDSGYQFCDGIISAESHGNPSKRSRYFSLLSLRGTNPVSFPAPTHSVPSREYKLEAQFSSTRLRKVQDLSERKALDQLHRFVPIGDALDSDLPTYEFAKPFRGPQDKLDPSRARFNPQPWRGGISIGYPEKVRYASIPKNALQRTLRINDTLTGKVSNHESKGTNGRTAYSLTEIGIRGQIVDGQVMKGNYLDMIQCRPALPIHLGKQKEIDMFWSRMEPQNLATPIRTTLLPDGYHGSRLHPSANRPISSLELARMMTIPDTASLGPEGSSIQLRNQIVGNSVPVVLGAAIGRAFASSIRALQLEAGFTKTANRARQFILDDEAFVKKFSSNMDVGEEDEAGELIIEEREGTPELEWEVVKKVERVVLVIDSDDSEDDD